jgi:hypothetical protein
MFILFKPIFGNTTKMYNKTMVYLNNNVIEQIRQKKINIWQLSTNTEYDL